MTSGFDQLERELRAAERRYGSGRRRASGSVRRRGWRSVPSSGSLAVAGGALVTVAVAAGALVLVNARRTDSQKSAGSPSQVAALVSELAILREPQSAQARAFNTSRVVMRMRQRAITPPQRLIPGLTRVAELPGGVRLFLYVSSPAAGPRQYGLGYYQTLYDGLGGGACCITASALRHPHGPSPDQYASGRHRTTLYFEIVPDGVTRVRWVFPRRALYPPGAPTQTFAAPLLVTVAVHGNIAARKLPQRGEAKEDTWYGADGRVIASYTATGGRPKKPR